MKILGLHAHAGQTAAAMLIDGEIKYAAAEERFDRIKQSRAFPKKAIDFCLREAGVGNVDELDAIAVSWNPSENMRNINLSGFTQWRRYDPEWLYIISNHLMGLAGTGGFPGAFSKLDLGNKSGCPIYFVNHHHCHLAHAICQSPFERGLALAVDEYGEHDSVTVTKFDGPSMDVVKTIAYPNSLGVFYAAITEYLGFTPNSDEWKLMGASAYGDGKRFEAQLSDILAWDGAHGEWILDTRLVEHSNMKRAGYLNERLIRLIGISPRLSDEELTQVHHDLAASAQLVFEKRLFEMLSHYAKSTGEKNLAASGGCFMNSLANGKIIGNTPFERIFIPYAAADNGGAMGSALYVWNYALGKPRTPSQIAPSPFLGPSYSDAEIEATLKKYKATYKRVENVAKYTAGKIAEGKLIGWFQGRMEFGERALGARSILGDPRDVAMKEKINSAVKYRESFRPFAPSILAEKAGEYFDLPSGVTVPYMEQVYPVKAEKRTIIPAVTHHDATGRLQMVERSSNPIFHELITEFEKISGVPVIINTSFNIQGEPIVCSPSDALRTFFTCGLDILVIGSLVVEKGL